MLLDLSPAAHPGSLDRLPPQSAATSLLSRRFLLEGALELRHALPHSHFGSIGSKLRSPAISGTVLTLPEACKLPISADARRRPALSAAERRSARVAPGRICG